jgi:phosphoesterase RecJ-like protein
VRTEAQGYTSCATVLWAMLKEEGFQVEDGQLPTLLYYGLYMDTQELKTAQKMDREMLDELKYDMDIVTELQSVNLSLEEIRITGRAYDSLHVNPQHHFAVAQVEPCDPDILGIVGDELMKVAGVDVSAAYCMLEGNQGAKLSVRCRRRGCSAVDLVQWLVRGMGNDGGGAPTKAAGRLPGEFLEEACTGDGWDDLSGATGRLIYRLLTDYFEIPPKQIRTGEYAPKKVREFCTDEPARYCKTKVPVGYVKATDLFPEGEEILIRMLEGDARKKVTPELYILIGIDGETYHNEESRLRKNYDLFDEPFPVDSESPWQPKIYRYSDRKACLLAPYARKCIARDGALIWASQLSCRLKVLTRWGEWHLGEAGDWLASQDADRQDIYIIQKAVFERTYEKAEG